MIKEKGGSSTQLDLERKALSVLKCIDILLYTSNFIQAF